MLFLWLLFKRKTFAKILAFAPNVVRLKKQGKALDEVISAKPTAGYDAKWVALSLARHSSHGSFTRGYDLHDSLLGISGKGR